jgi:Cu+-exporting ATPase
MAMISARIEWTFYNLRNMAETILDIRGMHCASCVSRVEGALSKVPGVSTAHVNLATNQGRVEYDSSRATVAELLEAVTVAGYSAQPIAQVPVAGQSPPDHANEESSFWFTRFVVASVLLGGLIEVHFLHLIDFAEAARYSGIEGNAANIQGLWQFALAMLMQLYVGWPFMQGAAKQLRHGAANMDTLIAIGTLAAYGAGVADYFRGVHGMNFMDGGMILTFITLGKYLEARAKGRASQAIRKLLELAPPVAHVERGGQLAELPPAEVGIGETIVVRPGDKVPLDAVVISGHGDVNEAWLTGEALPVAKQPGDAIYAGTVSDGTFNVGGSLRARVTRAAGDTWLAQTVALVTRVQESKADVQRLADWVVARFVPAILVIAALTFVAWSLTGHGGWQTGLSCAIAVLVVACPCALGLATPAAVLVGSGRGAENGILIKDAQALEIAGRLTSVVLDKTGTITLGRPEVKLVRPDGIAAERLLALAAGAERHSNHPLARALVRYAEERNIQPVRADSAAVIPGAGIAAESPEGTILVGTSELLAQRGIAATNGSTDAVEPGQTALQVALGGRRLGEIVLADVVNDTSRETVADLKRLGLTVTMLSGDRQETAEAIAGEVGIEHVIAEVKPDEKQAVIERLRAAGQVVAMVGDGINDAPALAAADLGIAMGLGADVAIESADIVLARHDLRLVGRAIRLSRATLSIIRQNLAWALVYNVALIPLAAGLAMPLFGIRLPPALAAAAMAASSVSVVLNSLRLRWIRLE